MISLINTLQPPSFGTIANTGVRPTTALGSPVGQTAGAWPSAPNALNAQFGKVSPNPSFGGTLTAQSAWGAPAAAASHFGAVRKVFGMNSPSISFLSPEFSFFSIATTWRY